MSSPLPDSANFYRNLPLLTSFAEATKSALHADVPGDWWIVVADITGSTEAIQAGAYKKVNTVGVACIAAVTNVDRDIDLPFVFGGDGATFAIPEVLRERVVIALRASQRLAREGFGLALRVGLVSVSELLDQGFAVRTGKVRLSPHATQAALSGRGWDEAERRVKHPEASGALRVEEGEGAAEASFEGFECRWQGVPCFHDHKLALLVMATSPEADSNFATYQRVLEKIQTIYGEVESYHPLRPNDLRMTFNPRLLSHEWRVRTGGFKGLGLWKRRLWARLLYFKKMLLQNLAGQLLFALHLDTAAVRWSRYRDELVQNSDFRKFDGTLRMIMDGSTTQTEQLQSYLEDEFRSGRLAYGMHKSYEALVTCIVQSYNGNHLHFVDGSDGGYALAARELKRRLSEISEMREIPKP